MPYLLRVRVPDQPGALGRLAGSLGAIGADIESLVVVDRAAGEAVDDLIVTLPGGGLADALVTAVQRVDGMVLEAIQPHPGRARVADELALLDAAAASPQPVAVVVDGLPDLLAVHYALAVDRSAPQPRVAATAGAPEAAPALGWLPLPDARIVPPGELFADPAAAGADAVLVAAPLWAGAAIVVGRNGGAEFRPAELLRLAHLGNLLRVAAAR